MTALYPQLYTSNLDALDIIKRQMLIHDNYLEAPDCPYDPEAKEIIRKLLAPTEKVIEKIVEKIVEKEGTQGGQRGRPRRQVVDVEEVETGVDDILQELKTLKTETAEKGLKVADRLSIIKLRASLVEKLVEMKAKITDARRQAHFESTVMDILSDLVPPERRDEFMERLAPFVKQEIQD